MQSFQLQGERHVDVHLEPHVEIREVCHRGEVNVAPQHDAEPLSATLGVGAAGGSLEQSRQSR